MHEFFSWYFVFFGISDLSEVIDASSMSLTSETRQLNSFRLESFRLERRRPGSRKDLRRFVFLVKEEPAAELFEIEIESWTLATFTAATGSKNPI